MPPAKKQKTGKNASAPAQEAGKEGSLPHKNDALSAPAILEYICVHRPRFDYEIESRDLDLDEDEVFEKYNEGFEKEVESGIMNKPASEHKEWKWIMLKDGFKAYMDLRRLASYTDPDNFEMHIYNDWAGYGLIETMENHLLAFDSALTGSKTKPKSLTEAWALVSALGIFLNEYDLQSFIGCEDGNRVKEITALMGTALLTVLAAMDLGGYLKPDSEYLDLAFIISSWLYFASDLEPYGIEDDAVDWRSHAADYFEKAKLDAGKGVTDTTKLLDDLKGDESERTPKAGGDPWSWTTRLERYKKSYGPRIGGSHFDITKMSRQKRAGYAFDGVDPLKDISAKDLKEGNLMLA